jgi:hypothetical protein
MDLSAKVKKKRWSEKDHLFINFFVLCYLTINFFVTILSGVIMRTK